MLLLKVSGEALMGDRHFGINPVTVDRIASEIKAVTELGTEICLLLVEVIFFGACLVLPQV